MSWRHNTRVHLGPGDEVGLTVDRPAELELRDYGNEVWLSLRGEDGAVLIQMDRRTWSRYVAPVLRQRPVPRLWEAIKRRLVYSVREWRL